MTEITDSARNVALQSSIQTEQLKLLFSAMPLALFAGLLVAGLLIAIQWTVTPQAMLLGWFSALALITVLRGMLALGFRHNPPSTREDTAAWERRFNIGVVSAALVWGSAAILLFPTDSLPHQAILALVLAGVGIAAVSSLSFMQCPINIMLITVMPIIGIRLLMTEAAISQTMGILVFLLLIMLYVSAHRMYRNTYQNLSLRFESAVREQILRQYQQKSTLHVEQTPLAVIEWDTNFKVMDWNPAAEKIFGYSSHEAIGRHATELIAPRHSLPRLDDIWQALLHQDGGLQSVNENVTKDGTRIVCEWYNTPLSDPTGQITGVMSMAQDITERTQAAHALQASECRFRSLVENATDAFFLHDVDGRLLDVNQQTCTSLGYSRDELLNMTVFDIEQGITPAKLKDIWPKLSDHKAMRLEGTHQRKDGSTFPVEVMISLLERDNQEVILALARDITERKQAEKALQSARDEAVQANMAKSDFLSHMSHELRTPLNAILGFTQLLKTAENHPLTEEQADQVEEIMSAGSHLLSLIDEILDLSKVESGALNLSMHNIQLAPLINDCLTLIKPLAAQRNIRIEQTMRYRGHEFIRADPIRLKQILLNLLSNAVKYNQESGSVSLACELTADGNIRITVSDTGPGLTAEQQQRLFHPFERLDAEYSQVQGTGIGLVISKRLIELMQGFIGVDSIPGHGSHFWIELPPLKTQTPFTDPEQPHGEPIERLHVGDTGVSTSNGVLFIEDNPVNLKLVQQLTARYADTKFLSTMDPEQGLKMARKYRPNMILLDINLPGIDGYEVLKQLHAMEELKTTPVIAISDNAAPSDIEKAYEAGFADYLTKPLRIPRFLEILDRFL